MNSKEAKRKMLAPRSITRATMGCESWYYIDHARIDVFIRLPGTGTFSATLSRRKLQQALAVMRAAKSTCKAQIGE